MTTIERRQIPWRLLGWGGAVALLALPFLAMQMDAPGVNWSPGDFIFAGSLLAIVGGLLELGFGRSRNTAYRAAFALAVLGMFLVIWVNLAVGIVGSEDSPANQWFFGALLVGLAGSIAARLRPAGMSWAMAATACALWGAFAIAVSAPTDEPFVPHLREFIGTSVFAVLFLASAALFRRAAGQSSSSS